MFINFPSQRQVWLSGRGVLMPDPRDLSPYRTITIVDIGETSYRVVGPHLERQQVLSENPDKFEVSHLCCMQPDGVREMTNGARALRTQEKSAIHQNMREYMLADDHALSPAPDLHLVGLLSEDRYNQVTHSWKNPAVVSKRIARIE